MWLMLPLQTCALVGPLQVICLLQCLGEPLPYKAKIPILGLLTRGHTIHPVLECVRCSKAGLLQMAACC